jgi:hypothetical protein
VNRFGINLISLLLSLSSGPILFAQGESLLHNLESDLKTHVSVDHVVRKC